MKVSELIKNLSSYHPDDDVMIEIRESLDEDRYDFVLDPISSISHNDGTEGFSIDLCPVINANKSQYDLLVETYKPIDNHITPGGSFNGWMFETYGAELMYVQFIAGKTPDRVATILDDSEGGLALASGYRSVNRIGYIIFEKPVPFNFVIPID